MSLAVEADTTRLEDVVTEGYGTFISSDVMGSSKGKQRLRQWADELDELDVD